MKKSRINVKQDEVKGTKCVPCIRKRWQSIRLWMFAKRILILNLANGAFVARFLFASVISSTHNCVNKFAHFLTAHALLKVHALVGGHTQFRRTWSRITPCDTHFLRINSRLYSCDDQLLSSISIVDQIFVFIKWRDRAFCNTLAKKYLAQLKNLVRHQHISKYSQTCVMESFFD